MRVRVFALSICLAAGVASAMAQPTAAPQRVTPRPAAEQPQPVAPVPAPAPPRRQGQPVNVKVDVTISDQHSGSAPVKKTVSVVTADNMGGFIRSTANYNNIGDVPLNVDVSPELLADGKIRVGVSLQYDLPGGAAKQSTDGPGLESRDLAGPLRRTQIRENLNVILENGKAITVAQSADPVGDRQVTIEIKATILR
ncbi:MAG TPA: hypothetical protein VGQ16_02035 [Vicinamibacterales bacterium]|jgi:hypothetical protein|nr:hypothetical protein [Vicinamibacterales bacterium]